MLLELEIQVGRIVDEIGKEVQIEVLVFRNILGQQASRHRAPFHHGLKHRQNIASPLWLIRQQRAWRVQDPRRHQPASARLQPVGLRKIQNPVVTGIPALQALANVLTGRARLKPEVGMREIAECRIQLRRKIVALGLAFAAHQLGLFFALMKMMHDGPGVVEKLAVDRPAMILLPHRFSNQPRPFGLHGLFKSEAMAV